MKNAAETLGDAVRSILSQSFSDFELLLIDDHSNDSSRELAEEFQQKDKRVRLLLSPAHGIAAALRYGFSQSRAKFIARMDADDLSDPRRFASQVSFMEQNEDIGVLATRVEHQAGSENSKGMDEFVKWNNSLHTPSEIYRARFIESPLVHPTVMFRREVALRYGVWRSGEFPEDYELWLRWLESGVRIEKLETSLLSWRDSPLRLSRNSKSYDTDAFYQTKTPYLARYLARKLKGKKRLVVLGAGRETRRRVGYLLQRGVRIDAWVDVDPTKIGRVYSGAEVIPTSELATVSDTMVLSYLAARGQREQAVSLLNSLSYQECEDYILCA